MLSCRRPALTRLGNPEVPYRDIMTAVRRDSRGAAVAFAALLAFLVLRFALHVI